VEDDGVGRVRVNSRGLEEDEVEDWRGLKDWRIRG
jgi:hypothetical protein